MSTLIIYVIEVTRWKFQAEPRSPRDASWARFLRDLWVHLKTWGCFFAMETLETGKNTKIIPLVTFFFKDPWKCKEKTTWTCSKDLPWCSTNTSDGFDAFHQTKRNFLAKQNQKLEPKWDFYGKDTILSNTWDIISSAGLTPRTPPWWRVEIRSDWLATNTHIGSMFCTSLVTNVFSPDKLLAVFERYRYTLSSQPSWGIQRCQWKIPFIDCAFDFPIISHFGSGISQPCRQMIHQTRHLQDPLTGTHVSMFHVEVRLPRSGRSLKYILHQPGTMNLLYSLEVTSVTFLWEPVRTQFQIG